MVKRVSIDALVHRVARHMRSIFATNSHVTANCYVTKIWPSVLEYAQIWFACRENLKMGRGHSMNMYTAKPD